MRTLTDPDKVSVTSIGAVNASFTKLPDGTPLPRVIRGAAQDPENAPRPIIESSSNGSMSFLIPVSFRDTSDTSFDEFARNCTMKESPPQNYPKASTELGESLKQREANLISNQKAVADAAGFLGASLYGEGKYRDSAVAYRRYLQLRPDDMGVTSDLGLSLLLAGDYAAAEFPLRRAVSGLENSPAPNNKLLVFGLNNLATLPRVMGQDAEAEALFRKSRPRYYLSMHKECNGLAQKRGQSGLQYAAAQFPS
jgi:hypothetical protein